MADDIFRTVRELLESSDCVLMGNAVNTEGRLYDDSVANLTAILAMQDSYNEMLAALEWWQAQMRDDNCDDMGKLLDEMSAKAHAAIAKSQGKPG
jgi:hypothetical protein